MQSRHGGRAGGRQPPLRHDAKPAAATAKVSRNAESIKRVYTKCLRSRNARQNRHRHSTAGHVEVVLKKALIVAADAQLLQQSSAIWRRPSDRLRTSLPSPTSPLAPPPPIAVPSRIEHGRRSRCTISCGSMSSNATCHRQRFSALKEYLSDCGCVLGAIASAKRISNRPTRYTPSRDSLPSADPAHARGQQFSFTRSVLQQSSDCTTNYNKQQVL